VTTAAQPKQQRVRSMAWGARARCRSSHCRGLHRSLRTCPIRARSATRRQDGGHRFGGLAGGCIYVMSPSATMAIAVLFMGEPLTAPQMIAFAIAARCWQRFQDGELKQP